MDKGLLTMKVGVTPRLFNPQMVNVLPNSDDIYSHNKVVGVKKPRCPTHIYYKALFHFHGSITY